MIIIFWTCYLILFLHSSECKDVIETDGIPKHWKQYLNYNKLRAQNKNLNTAKSDHGHQQSNLNLYKGVPLKIHKIAQPALNSNLNNALHLLNLNNNMKNIPQEHDNIVLQPTLNPNLKNVRYLLNLSSNNKNIPQEHDNKVTLQNNISNIESSKLKVHLNDKDDEKKKDNDDDLNKDAPKIDENSPKDKSNMSMKIVHHKENITEAHLNNSSDLVNKPNKTVGLVKNKDFETTQENEHGFVDNEELMDKLRDIGNGSTEIDWVQEESIQEIDNSPATQLPNLVYPLAKVEDMNRIKLNPNYPQGWIRYRFIPNQYSLSDRGNYINKVNLYTKDWYPYLRGRFRRDLN